MSLTPEERTWLETTCPYLKPSYLDYLAAYRFKPSQVQVSFVPCSPDSDEGHIEIEAFGPWAEAIFWEVPLLATLSEIYFTTVDKDWDYEGQAGASISASVYFKCRKTNFSVLLCKYRPCVREGHTAARGGLRVQRIWHASQALFSRSRPSSWSTSTRSGRPPRKRKASRNKQRRFYRGRLAFTADPVLQVHLARKYGLNPMGTIAQ